MAGQAQIKPAYSCVRLIVVPSGPDAADDYLVEHAVPGELVICSDVPLACNRRGRWAAMAVLVNQVTANTNDSSTVVRRG